MKRRLPVTLVGGFLGAGKTSLLHHFISGHHGGHLAILVENVGALNLDAKALQGLCGAMRRVQDTVLEIPGGDEAAQAAWIAAALRDFDQAGKFERVLIEVSGVANAARLAQHFGLLPGQPETFASWAELHQIVCVVDALDFHRATLKSSRTGAADPLLDFQRTQVEGASLVVLNKCDLIDDAQREACARALRLVNPDAPLVETAHGEIPSDILARRGTAPELRLAMVRRLQLLPDEHAIRLQEAGSTLAGALYRAYRPFHPGRFWDWFNADHPGLLRVKGLVWLATRNLLVGGVSRTRWQNACGAAGIWWAALPREEWPGEPEALRRMQETWREPYGDRRQELVLIGDGAQLSGPTRRQLEDCLLTDEEYARPVKEWAAWPDPFPAWDLEDG
jgi:G3E family GTPase